MSREFCIHKDGTLVGACQRFFGSDGYVGSHFLSQKPHSHGDGKRYVFCPQEYMNTSSSKKKVKSNVVGRGRFRPQLGKTHKRSPSATRRRNALHSKRSKRNAPYRFKGTELIHNILDVGTPAFYYERLGYHRNRYRRQRRNWVEPRYPPWGFRLLSERKFTLPMTVVKAIERIYSSVKYTPKPVRRERVRPRGNSQVRSTSRSRSQGDVIARLEAFLESSEGLNLPIDKFNRLNESLEEEILMRKRREYAKIYHFDRTVASAAYQEWLQNRYGSKPIKAHLVKGDRPDWIRPS